MEVLLCVTNSIYQRMKGETQILRCQDTHTKIAKNYYSPIISIVLEMIVWQAKCTIIR